MERVACEVKLHEGYSLSVSLAVRASLRTSSLWWEGGGYDKKTILEKTFNKHYPDFIFLKPSIL